MSQVKPKVTQAQINNWRSSVKNASKETRRDFRLNGSILNNQPGWTLYLGSSEVFIRTNGEVLWKNTRREFGKNDKFESLLPPGSIPEAQNRIW
jgi:hypothetical protein